MTKYREIIQLSILGLSQTNIALSYTASKTTINKVPKTTKSQSLSWALNPKLTDPVLGRLLFSDSKAKPAASKRMPDCEHIYKELLRNGVNKSFSGQSTLRNAASPEISHLCILSSAITSSRISRSAVYGKL